MGYANRPEGRVVLVVEDDPLLLLHSATVIEEAGFEVLEAHNADEAIVLLEARKDIAIVFTDIEMPGSMDGLKLAKAVRERWPPVHLILASGRTTPHPQEMPEGSRFFAKPWDSKHLVAAIAELAALPQSPDPSAN